MKSRDLKRYIKLAHQVDKLAVEFAAMTDQTLKKQTQIFKDQLQKGIALDTILIREYAIIREAD
ncbi:preprotein translocase subunit SecA [Weissella beninensis]|uniref:SecA family profile domain-containing protein n=1 Tax=Periweissella beninensis TaxID=504936 RepID=A0ABT0VI17_9LACO|nr:preprotein translocase subunit SecA [Periweissella beninensis]MCM2437460.1 hypothetical protein [Periweissella beninensis]